MTSLCDVSSLKKAKYGGQVLGPVLHSLLVEAYQQTTGAKDVSGLNTWAGKQEAPVFKYLLGIRDHIMSVKLLVKSQRGANFGETLLYSFCFRSCALSTVASRTRTRAEM